MTTAPNDSPITVVIERRALDCTPEFLKWMADWLRDTADIVEGWGASQPDDRSKT